MPEYLTPGVYVKELSGASRPIEGAPTGICALIGACEGAPDETPVFVESLADFELAFPGATAAVDDMWLAARGYFANGGKRAWVCPVLGGSSAAATAADYSRVLDRVMRELADVSALVYPDQHWEAVGNPVLAAAAVRCEVEQRCMLLVDPPAGYEFTGERSVRDLGLPIGRFSTLYYPWLKVLLPTGELAWVPPSAHVAGIWSRVDNRRGVWKAPAGLDANVVGAMDVQWHVSSLQQSRLNPLGVNCIRMFPGRGTLIWGARTRAAVNDPEWRHLPVRRTMTYIQQSIARSTSWTVFQPNDARLWQSLCSSIEGFLDGLFHQGALAGQKATDAYFVRCGLGETMAATDIQVGRVIVLLGVALLKPGEFIVLKLELVSAS